MSTPDDVGLGELRRAGSSALAFNAPLSESRARESMAFLGSNVPRTAVDLGCGTGRYLCMFAAAEPQLQGLGIDNDRQRVELARRAAAEAGLDTRLEFVVGDALSYQTEADAAICIGSSHACGGTSSMFERLAKVCSHGVAVVGDAIWASEPDEWCRAAFGDVPDGIAQLVALAGRFGWTVDDASVSSSDEWDHFERAWCRGVEAVGTERARLLAHERALEYEQRYRGILGFGWLYLHR